MIEHITVNNNFEIDINNILMWHKDILQPHDGELVILLYIEGQDSYAPIYSSSGYYSGGEWYVIPHECRSFSIHPALSAFKLPYSWKLIRWARFPMLLGRAHHNRKIV